MRRLSPIRAAPVADERRLVGFQAGFTLLEVILAIAILAVSLAAIGEIVRNSFNNTAGADESLRARMVAQSLIDQMKSGAAEIIDAGPMALPDTEAFGDWMVQVVVEPTTVEELVQVRVLVGADLQQGERPACELVRWFQNPEYAQAAAAAAASTTESATSL